MSRGGRGGGRGGRGGGNAARDSFNAAFAGMNKEDARTLYESFSKPVKGSGMLYPPLDKAAELPGPTPLEENVIKHSVELMRGLMDGPLVNGQRGGAPWRLASERKVVGIEIESYSDRYRRKAATTTTPGANGTTTIDAPALHLRESLFPPQLWSEYFDTTGASSSGDAAARAREKARKRRRILEDGGDDAAAGEEEEDEEEEEEDFDFDDEGDEDHQDYDHNYFDNGEGDDDSAGEGGEEDGGGGYDD
ncbi:uncharacterized protein EHS24_000946 [Apiotrichum porosum]|uniref:DNA-directed RNA polymerase III subunit n=1 Tax=Apiotrichum porosum TaxID=105984 RepID=A0A427YBD6_9TREE|nr:uncharacterized protein EHS24_000946 [Apiotrichum porosum]RSH88402.1 hypothetical protein EHS24_000946 [Apiotrichum porosum]